MQLLLAARTLPSLVFVVAGIFFAIASATVEPLPRKQTALSAFLNKPVSSVIRFAYPRFSAERGYCVIEHTDALF